MRVYADEFQKDERLQRENISVLQFEHMNKNTKTRNTKLKITLLVALVAVVGTAGVALFRANSYAAAENKTTEQESKSLFSFTGATGWRQGPSNETSMALFGKARADGTSACFVSAEYKPGKVDVDAALQKQQDSYKTTGGTMTQTATVTNVLQTNEGEKQYELRQYTVDGGSEKAMGGLELGYLQLKDGYVKVDGHCEAVEELAITIPALQAYKLSN